MKSNLHLKNTVIFGGSILRFLHYIYIYYFYNIDN
jgi:hypothetical protein